MCCYPLERPVLSSHDNTSNSAAAATPALRARAAQNRNDRVGLEAVMRRRSVGHDHRLVTPWLAALSRHPVGF